MEKLLNHKRPQEFTQHHSVAAKSGKNHQLQSGAGFTLVELLVYIGVSTIALLVFVTFMVDVSRSAARARTVQELHQNAQFVLDRIGQEVRSSQAIDAAGSTFNADAGTLTLTTSTGSHVFTLTGTTVTLNTGSGAAALTSPSVRVTRLRFTDTSPSTTVQLRVEEAMASASPQAIELQTILVPRQAVY